MKRFVAACLLGFMWISLASVDHADARARRGSHRVRVTSNSHGKGGHYVGGIRKK